MGHNPTRRGMPGIATTAAAAAAAPAITSAALLHHQSLQMMETATITPHSPDARLIRLCALWTKTTAEIEAIWSPFHASHDSPSPAAQERSDELGERKWRIEDLIARVPAHAAEGRQAKARVLLGMLGAPCQYDEPREVMARSLAADVLPAPLPEAKAAANEAALLALFRKSDPDQRAAIFRTLADMKAGVPHDVIEARLRAAFPQGVPA